jgi:hypothetical protein
MNKFVSIYLSFQKTQILRDDNFVCFFNEGTRLGDYCLKGLRHEIEFKYLDKNY